jgi:RNA polymerase sigma-70 factor (ECF subfamily)
VATAANGSPAFAQYRQDGAEPWALIVLELDGNRIRRMNYFLDTETLFPMYGLPMRLER